MFCTKCGADLPDQSPFCKFCGTATGASLIAAREDAPPPSAFEDAEKVSSSPPIHPAASSGAAWQFGLSQPPSTQTPLLPAGTMPWSKSWLWIIPIAVLLISLAYIGSKQPDAGASSSGDLPEQQANKKWPELKFQSAGRLPTTIHGFRLGMSVAEALQVDSTLTNGINQNPSDEDYMLSRTLPSGLDIELRFTGDRLYLINEKIWRISPDDATQVERNTYTMLGAANLSPFDWYGRAWVWIDGDVRARLSSEHTNPTGSPVHLSFELIAFPVVSKCAQMHPDSNMDMADVCARAKERWGEAPSEPIVARPMPTEMFGLQLGMVPWQVRDVIPGIDIYAVGVNSAGHDETG